MKKRFDKWDLVLVIISVISFVLLWWLYTLETRPIIEAVRIVVGFLASLMLVGVLFRIVFLDKIIRKAIRN